jgi:hypothetical protein
MLRSHYVALDYHIAATDGEIGRVRDFLFDDTSWIVHYLVAEIASALGNRKQIRTSPTSGKAVWVNHSLQELDNNPDFDPEAAVNEDEHGWSDYHGRPAHSEEEAQISRR